MFARIVISLEDCQLCERITIVGWYNGLPM